MSRGNNREILFVGIANRVNYDESLPMSGSFHLIVCGGGGGGGMEIRNSTSPPPPPPQAIIQISGGGEKRSKFPDLLNRNLEVAANKQ